MSEENKTSFNIEAGPIASATSNINNSVVGPANTTITNQEVIPELVQEALPKSVIIALVVGWILYVPPAFLFFGLSLMAGDSGSTLLLLQGMSINLIPFSLMAIFTYIAIKKKSLILAIATPIITLTGSIAIYKIFVYEVYTKPAAAEFARKKAIVIRPEENRFVCSQDLYIETFKNPAILVERKLTGKIGDYEFTPAIGNIENNEIKVLDYFATNKERMRTLEECKNSEGKTFSEKYTVVR